MLWCTLFIFLCMQPPVFGACHKKGISHHWKTMLCDDFDVLNNWEWWYSWGCNATKFHENNTCTSQIDGWMDQPKFCPMIWGAYANTNYSCYHDLNVTTILGFNEPNHKKQSKLTPAEAALAWTYLQGNATDYLKVTPSAAPCGGNNCYHGNTIQWFTDFFGNCTNCTFDYLATHAYYCNATKTMEHLESLYEAFGYPMWLTEFACRAGYNNATKVLEYMTEILPLLDSYPHVHRYAWFGTRIPNNDGWVKTSASLFYPTNSTLTPLGQHYQDHNC